MKKRKKREIDPDMPVGKLRVVKDFLPPPEELVKYKIKVTMELSQDSVNFFKSKAKQNKTKYQKMIREVLDQYVRRYNTDS